MKKSAKVTGSILAVALISAPVYTLAQTDAGKTVTDHAATIEQAAPAPESIGKLKISENARNAMSGIHFARQALNHGDTDAAKAILDEITGLFGDSDAALTVKTESGFALPIEQGFGLPKGFKPAEEHAPVFAEADLLMRSGDLNGVITAFSDAGIDLVAQVALVPYSATIDGLKQVVADLDAGQIEKAGKDLDAMLTAVKVESYSRDALPKQGYPPGDIAQS